MCSYHWYQQNAGNKVLKHMLYIQDAVIASVNMALGWRRRAHTGLGSDAERQSSVERSDDVFEAERAVAGETLAFASAAQVLSVGPLGVDVALCQCTAATCFVAGLGGKQKGGWLAFSRDSGAISFYRTRRRRRAYVTCDVLHSIRVELLLAFPTVLLEVNLEHTGPQLEQLLTL